MDHISIRVIDKLNIQTPNRTYEICYIAKQYVYDRNESNIFIITNMMTAIRQLIGINYSANIYLPNDNTNSFLDNDIHTINQIIHIGDDIELISPTTTINVGEDCTDLIDKLDQYVHNQCSIEEVLTILRDTKVTVI